MNNNRTKAIVVVVFLLLVASLVIGRGFGKETHALADVKLLDETKSDMYALYKKVDGVYQPVEDKTFPEGYTLNLSESKCIDNNGSIVSDALNYENGKVILQSNRSSYCYLYFDEITE